MDTREEYVEHYRVARGWRGYDTMSKTGILARMLEDGTVEIVATNTSIPFVSITLSADGESVKSDDVQRGSDLNYTVGNTTRAAFMGEDAQRLCDFASRHVDGSVTLSFNGAKSQRIVLSQRQKGMLAIFSRVISAKQQLDSLQRGFMVAFNKMQLYRNEVTKDSIANSKKEE